MSGSNYRELNVWKKARLLTRHIYELTSSFPRMEMYGLTQQMRRASISILCNIAEGRGRTTRGEYRNFVGIARGSAYEVEAQLVIAGDLEFINAQLADRLMDETLEIIRMLNALLRNLNQP